MNILAIGAHPDDVESGCAGTLAKYAKAGHKVFTATATNGNIGSATIPMEEIAKIRKEEARKAAAHIGAEYICLDYDDEMFFEDKAARLKFINLVRYCKADVILTHNPVDYNPDHELTSKIINDIAVMIPIAKLKTESPPYDKIPAIFYFEPAHSFGFIPAEYVDITGFMELKMTMLAEHKSQSQWMHDNYTESAGQFEGEDDYFETVRVMSRFRGIQCGVRYAEAFVPALDAFRVRPYRILP
jgi:LmbE family N-acetylglucosaminyl deacetylase